MGLPHRPGDVLVSEIRAKYPNMPIIIASGQGESALREKFRDYRAITFLSKPYFSDRLREALATLNVWAN